MALMSPRVRLERVSTLVAVAAAWQAVADATTAEGVPCDRFLDAAYATCGTLLEPLGAVVKTVKVDMKKNADCIRRNAERIGMRLTTNLHLPHSLLLHSSGALVQYQAARATDGATCTPHSAGWASWSMGASALRRPQRSEI